jgi:putative hydrolase of the HAD superfamily
MNVKNIVFDFGGVLLDLEPSHSNESMAKVLDCDDINAMYEEHKSLFIEFEKGNLRYENFLWNVQRLGKKVPDPKSTIDAWNAMLKGWNTKKFDLLKALKAKYKLYLLSNTNEIHMQWVKNDLRITHGIDDFDTRFFDKTYYSYKLGMIKPDRAIFQYVIDDAGIDPTESIYIDDLQENVDAALKLGFRAVLHPRNGNLDYLLYQQ